jgi:glycosyltransferase involved in cell wall biosynthesis
VYPPDLGGPATFVPRFAAHLVAHGHRVVVLTFGAVTAAAAEPWTVVAVPRVALPLRYARFLARCLGLAADADVVFACEHPRLFSVVAARLARRPLAVRVMVDTAWEMSYRMGLTVADPETFRLEPQPLPARLLQLLERWELGHADRVVAVAEHLARMAVAMGAARERTVVCKNLPPTPAPPVGDDRDRARRALGIDPGCFHLLVVSRLVPWKGVADVLAAAEHLADGWRLTVVGDGPCAAALAHQVAASPRLSGRVDLVGAVDHETTLSAMRASDALILTSRYEGLSHVLLEAMAVGLPMVVADTPGNRELVRHRHSGLLIPPGDVAAIAAAIEELRRAPAEGARLAAGARADLDDLVRDHSLDRLEQILIGVARGQAGSGRG